MPIESFYKDEAGEGFEDPEDNRKVPDPERTDQKFQPPRDAVAENVQHINRAEKLLRKPQEENEVADAALTHQLVQEEAESTQGYAHPVSKEDEPDWDEDEKPEKDPKTSTSSSSRGKGKPFPSGKQRPGAKAMAPPEDAEFPSSSKQVTC